MPRKKRIAKKETREYTAVTWLEEHPEDIPIARENLEARKRGFSNDDIRQLMAAMCLRACVDYKKACNPRNRNTEQGEKAIDECRKFFKGEIFQYFTNGMSLNEIERIIRATPDGGIHQIWRKMENDQAARCID